MIIQINGGPGLEDDLPDMASLLILIKEAQKEVRKNAMSNDYRIMVYGASGYTGKLVCESLAQRGLPFIMAGRNMAKLEAALEVVKERHDGPVDAKLVSVNNTVEEMSAALTDVVAVVNNVGPFMQLGWPVVEACLASNTHYLDTTGEQDWTDAIKQKFGQAFADKGLLLSPACSWMWSAGALAAEVVLEDPEIDSLDIVYQVDHGLPSEASTKSFLRMVCNDVSQYYLELNELKAWDNLAAPMVAVPHRGAMLRAHPWGGGCEPIWYADDDRVRNCKVITAIGEHLVDGVIAAITAFNEQAAHLSQEEREAWTNNMGNEMDSGEPPKDDVDVQRSIITCRGQGRQKNTEFALSVAAPYTFTGDICAEAAERLVNGQLKKPGFQSTAAAFGHRELLKTFNERGFCNLPD